MSIIHVITNGIEQRVMGDQEALDFMWKEGLRPSCPVDGDAVRQDTMDKLWKDGVRPSGGVQSLLDRQCEGTCGAIVELTDRCERAERVIEDTDALTLAVICDERDAAIASAEKSEMRVLVSEERYEQALAAREAMKRERDHVQGCFDRIVLECDEWKRRAENYKCERNYERDRANRYALGMKP